MNERLKNDFSKETLAQLEAFSFTYALAVTDEAASIFNEIGTGTAPSILRGDILEINNSLRKLRTKVIKLLHESNLTFVPDEN